MCPTVLWGLEAPEAGGLVMGREWPCQEAGSTEAWRLHLEDGGVQRLEGGGSEVMSEAGAWGLEARRRMCRAGS